MFLRKIEMKTPICGIIITGMMLFLFVENGATKERHIILPSKIYHKLDHRHERVIVPHFVTPCCEASSIRPIDVRKEIVIPQQEVMVIPEQSIPESTHYPVHGILIPGPPVPHVTIPHITKPRLKRINPSKAPTIEKYVIGEVACPLDLPKGGIVRVCNARSAKYKLIEGDETRYFHQQQCWFCENILGGRYVRWQDYMQ